jgi:hypothetical protein
MTKGLKVRIVLAGLLTLLLFACGSCIFIDTSDMTWHDRGDLAKHENQVQSAPHLTAGFSFVAETGAGSIPIR